jgi:hypothetical protein
MNHLLWVVGLITLAFGGYEAYDYMGTSTGGPKTSLYIAFAAFAVSLICWAMFFFRRFREEGEQDISITKP